MKRVGSIEVLGKGWDLTLGGLAYDDRLVEYMADHFNREWRHARSHDKDIRDVPRAMTKIRLQANKVKHVLSANQEIPVMMDSLYDDMSLSMHITRSQFEELCEDLTKRSTDPITDALAAANVTLDEITAIELIGGGMRVPKVQSGLSTVFGDMELGMHINSDESMALGAAFYGANISTAFRVRQVGLTDINPFAMGVTLKDLETDEEKEADEEEEVWGKKATIFKENGKIGVKKTIAFTHDRDVHCSLDYSESNNLPEGVKTELQRFRVSGVSTFAKEMEDIGLGKPKISLQFELSRSGTAALIKAEAAVEEIYTVEVEVEIEDDENEEVSTNETSLSEDENENKDSSPENDSDGTSKDDKATSSEDEIKDTTTKEESSPSEGESNETMIEDKIENEAEEDSESRNEKSKKKKTRLVEKEKKRTHRKSLDVETYYIGNIQPLSKDLIEEYKGNIAELARLDKERILLEEAKNKLESYFYSVKNKLLDNEEDIAKISTEEQREELRKLSSETEDWLFDEGDTADLETIQSKYDDLATPAEKVWFRLKESTARPAAVETLNEKLVEIEEKFTKWATNLTHITEEEKGDVFAKIESARKWLADKVDEQSQQAAHDEPTFTSEDVPLQTKPIQKLISKLSKKPKPKPKIEKKEIEKNNTEDKVSNGDENESDTTETETSEEAADKGNDLNEEKEDSGETKIPVNDTNEDEKSGEPEMDEVDKEL